jgi:hypothetical protein
VDLGWGDAVSLRNFQVDGNVTEAELLKRNLGAIGHQLAEMRNQSGTGHGKSAGHVSLEKKHAKLAVGARGNACSFPLRMPRS